MAVAARQLIQDEIMSGYGDPIWDTGNLHGSIAYDEPSKNSIHVGTNVEYAGYVHDGTYKMQERPFIRSALAGAQTALEQVAEQALRRSMG